MKLLFSLSEKDHGAGPAKLAWQKTTGNCLAVAGSKPTVYIYNRHGDLLEEINLPGACLSLCWDKDGDVLAILNAKTNVIFLWDANNRKVTHLDTSVGLKDIPTFATWAKSSSILCVGNQKGNVLIYNHQTSRKMPILGKHTRRITCGAFSDKNLLALGADDETISVSNAEGDTMYTFTCNGEPSQIQFAEMKESERVADGDTTISAIIAQKTLMLINLNEAENPVNLQFQLRYGNIVEYAWFGDGYILIGFSLGFVVSISTHVSEIGQEIFSVAEHKSNLTGLAITSSFSKAISAGDTSVKVRELGNLGELYAILPIEGSERGLDRVRVTDDGQLLAVSTLTGVAHVYLTKLPTLSDAFRTRIACLTSLTEITVSNEVEHEKPVVFALDLEPGFVAVGRYHVAAGTNNRVCFYHIRGDGAELVNEREHLGTVTQIKLNDDYAAVMFDGKVQLNKIERTQSEERTRLFPDADKSPAQITCMTLTPDFLIFGTNGGHLQYFYLDDWKIVNEYRHSIGIRSVHAEPSGTRLVFVDDRMDGFVYNPANDSLIDIKECSGKIRGILWENYLPDRDIFVAYDMDQFTTFMLYRDTVEGPRLVSAGVTKYLHGQVPLMLFEGSVTLQAMSGKTNTVQLSTHQFDETLGTKNMQELETLLDRAIVLKRWQNASSVCTQLNSQEHWRKLGKAGLMHLDLDFAMRVYRQISDVSMVWSLESFKDIEDRNLLAGHLAMCLDEFDLAEKLYLESSQPITALELRRDLLHWDKALQLASRLAQNQIPLISKEYAQQLEFTGDYANALAHYEQGFVSNDEALKEHNDSCRAGVARMSIRTGDIRKGVKLATESNNRTLKKDCAAILESMKQYNDAAILYEAGNFFDKAAVVYIRSKNWLKVGELLPKVNSPKIHLQYAKAMEADKKYKLALEAYKSAKDYDNVVRVLLELLNSPEEAVKVVRETKSVEGAKLVAKFFMKLNDHSSAIQFLVLSQCREEALNMAQQHDKMEILAEVIGSEGTEEEFDRMAQHFEKKLNYKLAGKYYFHAGRYQKALEHLISNGEDHESIKLAIECVGISNDQDLRRRLIDFLMGEVDGIPKDAKYLFRLYMALKMYREAAKIAIIIAREEQNNGQYRVAHDVLFSMFQELKTQHIKIPAEMETNLMLIHSYLLAKLHIKRGEHKNAARMLSRVSGNLSKFPSHAVQILTSAVIECQRSGLKASAFKFAAMLMRPEYRSHIDEKYKKKIEGIVRKPEKGEEEEKSTPCPFCNQPIAETELMCQSCKSTIPYCIATGKHMTKDDFGCCPNCKFSALVSELQQLLHSDNPCPMCGEKVKSSAVEKIDDIAKFLQPDPEATV